MPLDLSYQKKNLSTSRTIANEYLTDTVILPSHLCVNCNRLLRIHPICPEDSHIIYSPQTSAGGQATSLVKTGRT